MHTHTYRACVQAYYALGCSTQRQGGGRRGWFAKLQRACPPKPLVLRSDCTISPTISLSFTKVGILCIPIVKIRGDNRAPVNPALISPCPPQRRSPPTPPPGPALLVTLVTGPHDTRVQKPRSRGSSVTGDEPSSRCHHKKKAAETTVT